MAAAKSESVEQVAPATELAYIVLYPKISVISDGKEIVLARGERLPAEVAAARGPFLQSIGHVTALAVPAQ